MAKKQVEVASTSAQSGKALVIDLEQEWDKFNKNLHRDTNIEQTSELQTPKQTQHKENPGKAKEGATGTQDIEIIPTIPTSEIILRIEEMPPLDIFYCPTHKVVVRRQKEEKKTRCHGCYNFGK